MGSRIKEKVAPILLKKVVVQNAGYYQWNNQDTGFLIEDQDTCCQPGHKHKVKVKEVFVAILFWSYRQQHKQRHRSMGRQKKKPSTQVAPGRQKNYYPLNNC